VIFSSDRDGVFHLFKQAIDQPAPDLLVGGDQSVTSARLNPDSSEILFVRNPDPGDRQWLTRLMRLPLSGGTPQLVLAEPGITNFQCSRTPSAVCVLSQVSSDSLDFFTFDPVTGKKTPLTRIEGAASHLENWSLCPDGLILALAKKTHVPGPATFAFFPSLMARIALSHCRTGPASPAWTGPPMDAPSGLPLRRRPAYQRS